LHYRVTDGGSDASVDIYVLGAAFQKNVVSVFDVCAAELRLAAREYYVSNDPV
jgi:aspergillopepsin I